MWQSPSQSSPAISQLFHLFAIQTHLHCREIAKTCLQVTRLDATGSPRVQDELFPELQVGELPSSCVECMPRIWPKLPGIILVTLPVTQTRWRMTSP